jgi:hypothetical protein
MSLVFGSRHLHRINFSHQLVLPEQSGHCLLSSVVIKQNVTPNQDYKASGHSHSVDTSTVKGDYRSIRMLLRYAGLDRLLHEPDREPQGLSAETAQAIRREVAGDLYRPGTQEGSVSKPEALPAFANAEQETRSGRGIPGQPYQVGYRIADKQHSDRSR